jgi:hypothetical protein
MRRIRKELLASHIILDLELLSQWLALPSLQGHIGSLALLEIKAHQFIQLIFQILFVYSTIYLVEQ